MSTILDALRKLEDERRSRTADVRSRLLLFSAHQIRPLQLRQPTWRTHTGLIGIFSFVFAGFVAGTAVMFWRSYSSAPQPEQVSVLPPTNNLSDRQTETLANIHPSALPHSEVTTTTPAQTAPQTAQSSTQTESVNQITPPEHASTDSTSVAVDAAPSLSSSPTAENDTTLATTSAIQRSPFISSFSPSAVRESASRSSVTSSAQPFPSSTPHRQQTAAAPSPPLPSASQRQTPRDATPTPQTPWDQYVQKSQQQAARETTASTPAGTSLSFLQWSSDPERRIAFLRVNGGPLTMAHEGDTINGYTVVEIRQNAVELQSGETKMTLRTP
jgi:hypothetical protein